MWALLIALSPRGWPAPRGGGASGRTGSRQRLAVVWLPAAQHGEREPVRAVAYCDQGHSGACRGPAGASR